MSAKSKELVLLGKEIRKIRESQGLSQDKFAYQIDLGRSYYGSLERGEINASILTLLKVTKGLGVDLKSIIPSGL